MPVTRSVLNSLTPLKANTLYRIELGNKSEHSLLNFHFGTAWSDVLSKTTKEYENYHNLTRFCNLRHNSFFDLASLSCLNYQMRNRRRNRIFL